MRSGSGVHSRILSSSGQQLSPISTAAQFEYRAATVASNRKSGVTVESRWVFMLKSLTFSQWSFELKAATKYETRPNRESALRVSESERAWTNGEVCGCIANQSGPLGDLIEMVGAIETDERTKARCEHH